MGLTFDDVHALASALPGVSVGAKWGKRTWMVGDKGFVWERPLSKADLARYGDETPPSGQLLAVWTGTLDAKDALLAIGLPGFFTIPHFNNYPAVLVALQEARKKDVRAVIADAYRAVAVAAAAKSARRAKKAP